MKHKIVRLKNNLRLITIPYASLDSAAVTVWVRTGSRNETERISGISHFLEHMTFKGGRKYASAYDVAMAIDTIGGEVNAGTSKEWTSFYVKSRNKTLEKAFDVLSDIVLYPKLAEEEIEKEKKVIIEEIAMYEDTPVRRVSDIFDHVIFRGHPLARDIAGTKETVNGLKRDDFVSYRERHFDADHMLITVAGGIDEKKVHDLAEKYFGTVKKGKGLKEKEFITGQRKPRMKVIKKKIEQGHFVVGFRGLPVGTKYRFQEAVLEAVLGGGMSSRLFTEVREKRGLAYAVKTGVENLVDTGYLAVYSGVDPKNTTQALKVILDQCFGLAEKRYKIEEVEFEKAKEYIKGHFALSLEDTLSASSFFALEELFLEKTISPDDVYQGIEKVTKEEVYALAKKIFTKDRLNFALISPANSEKEIKKILG